MEKNYSFHALGVAFILAAAPAAYAAGRMYLAAGKYNNAQYVFINHNNYYSPHLLLCFLIWFCVYSCIFVIWITSILFLLSIKLPR